MVGLRVWNTLSTQAAFCRALLLILWMWGDQERSSLTVTPRSRRVDIGVREHPAGVVYWKSSLVKGSSLRSFDFAALWCMNWNLSSCRDILFNVDQLITLSRSLWSNAISSSTRIALEIRVSSAKHRSVESLTHCVISLMNSKNKMGPSTVPCGTPLIMVALSDLLPLTTTCCVRWTRNDSIHLIILYTL